MRLKACVVLLVLACISADAQTWQWQGSRVVLAGEDHRFSFIVPRGWSLDTADRAMRSAVRAVVYFGEGRSPFDRIHVALATKRLEGEKTLQNLLEYVYPGWPPPGDSVLVEHTALSAEDGRPATVKVTRTSRSQTAAAYIDDARVVVVIHHTLGASSEPFATRFRDLKAIVESLKVEQE